LGAANGSAEIRSAQFASRSIATRGLEIGPQLGFQPSHPSGLILFSRGLAGGCDEPLILG
jgi:hypothetical protein